MKRQKDWFTGVNYYDNYREKEIFMEEKTCRQSERPGFHEQVELLYIEEGSGELEVNGLSYPMRRGSFFCLYSHHFHGIKKVQEPVRVFSVKFYIGLFMYMCWEKHPKDAHEKLVYDTCPYVSLQGREREELEELMSRLKREKKEERFENKNLVEYLTLALHAYHCRYAFEKIGKNGKERSRVWQAIESAILSTEDKLSLEHLAKDAGCSERMLNRRIKEESGYTFFQLQQYGKVLNACALMHFPELSLEYISDLLGFSSKTAFYRVFRQYMGFTPREYQEGYIIGNSSTRKKEALGLQILQYIHFNFSQDISLKDICREYALKEYTLREAMEQIFHKSFSELLSEVRISYACSLLAATKETILNISGWCGFNSLSTFQREFSLCMGQTPGEYRRQWNAKNKNKTL